MSNHMHQTYYKFTFLDGKNFLLFISPQQFVRHFIRRFEFFASDIEIFESVYAYALCNLFHNWLNDGTSNGNSVVNVSFVSY